MFLFRIRIFGYLDAKYIYIFDFIEKKATRKFFLVRLMYFLSHREKQKNYMTYKKSKINLYENLYKPHM